MPFINIATSACVYDKKTFLEDITSLISSLTNKSKRFVMAKLEDELQMYFDSNANCCFLEIKSIGSLNPSEISKPICDFIHEKIGVSTDKIYIYFEDVSPSMWGWNGKTFG